MEKTDIVYTHLSSESVRYPLVTNGKLTLPVAGDSRSTGTGGRVLRPNLAVPNGSGAGGIKQRKSSPVVRDGKPNGLTYRR